MPDMMHERPARPYMQGVENKRCYELNEEDINKIREEVGKYTTEADLVSAASVADAAMKTLHAACLLVPHHHKSHAWCSC
jgi:hypothetical protein